MGRQGIRLKIEFTKPNGKVSRYWTSAPKRWDVMGNVAREGWVHGAANQHSPGASGAHVIERG